MTTFERANQTANQLTSDPRLNLAIIEANLSLFRWERGEARRYLADYAEEADSDRHDPLVLWLNALAQDDPEDRIEQLEMLTTLVDEDNVYARLAKTILENEAKYAALPRAKPRPEKRIMGLPRRMFFGVIVVFVLGLVALLLISNGTGASAAAVTATVDPNTLAPTATFVPTLLPVHNVPLPSDGYSVQYSAGLLQVTSVEDSSQRVVGTDGTVLQPIKGARFYALDLLFECQIGICDTPPEAGLSLQVDDKLVVTPRDGALIQAGDVLQPLAQGRGTDGWVIFEIPAGSVIDSLLIAPKDAAQNAAPLVINLGNGNPMTTILELQQKSAELRHAALRFQTSANTLRAITGHVSQIGDDLALLGYESPAAAQWMGHYRSEHQWMNGWADTMIHFAQSLTQAADQIDAAIAQMEHPAPSHAHATAAVTTAPTVPPAAPPPLASAHVLHPTLAQMKPLDTLETIYGKVKDAAFARMRDVTPNVDQYLSAYNHSRLDTFMVEQQTLAAKQVGLSNMMAQRGSAEQTLHMLMEHSLSDPRPELVKLTQTTQEQIRQLDAQIKSARADVDSLQSDVTTLQQRLALLRPPSDASLRLIHSMESGTSPQWLVDSTFDCVRYIVSKVHVPPGLAHDAYLWNDQTNVLQEYGINVGHIPMPGAVLVMERTHPYADPVHGHLMYVEKVDNNGEVWITDNLHPHPVKLSALTDQTSGSNMEYLYFPWQTHA